MASIKTVELFDSDPEDTDKHYVYLEDLEQWIAEDDYTSLSNQYEIDGKYYSELPDHAMYCEYTQEYHWDDDMVRLVDDDDYCHSDFANRHYYLSDVDGEYYRYGENLPENQGRGLHDAGTEVQYHLGFGDKENCIVLNNEPLYLGVELEVDSDDVSRLNDKLPNWLLGKEDGSLSENGIELVTKPLGLKDHKELWPQFLKDNKDLIDSPTSGYGLHIHISKKCLTKVEQARIVKFIHDAAHREFIIALSRREESDLNRWAKLHENDLNSTIFFERTLGKEPNHPDKYRAANVVNDSTIEFRLFASTDDTNELFTALEFCQAIAHYVTDTRKLQASLCLSLDIFAWWLNGKEEYKNIKAYIDNWYGRLVSDTIKAVA